MRQYFCLNWVLIDNLFDRSRDDRAKICWPATVKKLFWTGSMDQVHKKRGPREECSDMGRGNRTVFCTMYVNTVLVALRKQTWNKKINWLTRQPCLWTKQPKIISQNLYINYKQRFQFPVKENAFVSVHQHARGWGGGKVLQISSDRDDLMGAKLRTDKIPRAPKKTPKTSQDHNKPQ